MAREFIDYEIFLYMTPPPSIALGAMRTRGRAMLKKRKGSLARKIVKNKSTISEFP